MNDLVRRALNYLMAALLVPASRLVRVAALRELIEAFTSAYDEAARLEASGKIQLAQFLRNELEETLAAPPAGEPTPPPALNGDAYRHSFSLPRPDAAPNEPEGQGSATPGRRGRRPRNSAPAHEAPREQAKEPADPSTTPISNSNHHI